MFLHICHVDPVERVHEQIVQCRRDVPHQGHQEQGNLKDVFFEKVKAMNELIIPCDRVEAEEE